MKNSTPGSGLQHSLPNSTFIKGEAEGEREPGPGDGGGGP